MDENIGKNSFDFSVHIVKLCQQLQIENKELILCEKLLRCGTAIGAFVARAKHPENIEDYIHLLSVAQKKAHETVYLLDLMHQSNSLDLNQFTPIYTEANEVCNLLDKIIIELKIKNN